MNNIELLKIISEFRKFPQCEMINSASVCNDGFPGNFNLSFIESEWLREFNGQYLTYDHDYVVSKIQPCIRHQDWEIIKNDNINRNRYLGVFEMADVGGVINLVDGERIFEAVSFSQKSLIDFFKTIGLSLEKIKITYCIGGSIEHLTKSKYPLKKELPKDIFVDNWEKLGIKNSQFIPDETRDTLLSLNIYGLPTPWGYRNEVLYEHNGKLLDIATFEYLYYRPIFNENNIIDISRWENCFSISAVGVERLLMALDSREQITDVDYIKPIKEYILSLSSQSNMAQAIIFTEAIRTIHRIITDCGGYKKLSKHRKQKIRSYLNGLYESAGKLNIKLSEKVLSDILSKNAQLQPYYPELKQSVILTINEILQSKVESVGNNIYA